MIPADSVSISVAADTNDFQLMVAEFNSRADGEPAVHAVTVSPDQKQCSFTGNGVEYRLTCPA